jgi:hypothetical protein
MNYGASSGHFAGCEHFADLGERPVIAKIYVHDVCWSLRFTSAVTSFDYTWLLGILNDKA